MSNTIDQKVVEMRFDNQQFESGAAKSMSTIDKLKQKLKFDGATKGLENVNSAANKIDFKRIENTACDAGFRIRDVWTKTASVLEYQIAGKIINIGKNMASALTIDPIKTGFQEYETQMNAVQTILANTQSKGSTLKDVNKALDELNLYADKTIYNFTEMTRNIGTFTAAGVDLQTSVDSIQGIANLAAVSGSTSQQASTAMYQLSQALASGTVKLMDWNSVVNAGMGGQVFQDALKETSELLGTGAEAAIKAEGSFRESLRSGWLTSEVLTATLRKFTTTGANERVAEYTGLSKEAVEAALESAEAQYGEADAIEHASKALAEKSGKSADEIKKTLQFAKTAEDAATKVKTFSQLWDVMKESAQSGWSQTWKLIVGDFEEAKALLTPLADFFTGAIGKMSDVRNRILQIALDFATPWNAIKDKIDNVKKVVDKVTSVTDKLGYFQEVVDKVWMGDYNNWGDNPDRRDLLKAAGYDPRVVQYLVNLGEESWQAGQVYKLSVEEIEEAHKAFGLTMESGVEETENISSAIEKLSDEQLKNAGLTKEEIALYRALEKEAKRSGMTMSELADEMSKTNGRDLLIDSFKNIGQAILGIGKACKEAWVDIFNPPSTEVIGIRLYGMIKSFNEFTKSLRLTDEKTGKLNKTGQKIQRTLKGVFAALDIGLTLVGGPLQIAFKILLKVLKACDVDILGITAKIGDAIVKFRDWLDSVIDFTKVFEKITPYIKKASSAIGDWIKSVAPLEKIGAFFKKAGSAFKEWFEGLKEAENIPKYIIQGLVNGLKSGVTAVGQAIAKIGKAIIDSICKVLGIHSPSLVFMAIGGFIMAGLILGIQNGAPQVLDALKKFGSKCIELAKNIDIGAVIATVTTIGMTIAANKIGNAWMSIASAFEGFGDFLEGVGVGLKRMFTGIGKWFKAGALEKRSKAILNFAIALGILSASLYVLTKIKDDGLWEAVGAIAVLAAILVALSIAISKLNGLDTASINKTGLNIQKTASTIIPIAASLLLIAAAVKTLGTMSVGDIKKGIATVIGLGALLVALIAATKLAGPSFDKSGINLLKIASTISLLVFTIKMIDKLEVASLVKGMVFIGLFGAFIVGMVAATKLAGPNVDGLGATIFKMSAAILLLAFTARIIGGMDAKSMIKGGAAIVAFGGIIAGLIWMTKIAGGATIGKMGSTILAFSAAMLIMAFAVNTIGRLDVETITKGTLAVTAFGGIIAGLVYVTKYAGVTKGLASTVLAASIAIGILAAISVLLGLVEIEHLVKGMIAVGLLAGIMAGLIVATKNAQNCKGNLIVMTVAIGVLAAAIAGLSFIDPKKLAAASASLGLVMGMFALMIASARSLAPIKSMIGPLTIMLGVTVILAGVIWALSALKVDAALTSVAGLSMLMVSMSASLVLLSAVGKFAKDAFIGVGAFATLAASLFILVDVLTTMDGLNNAISNAFALTMLVTAMSLMLIPLSAVGSMGATGLPFIGVGALATLAASLFIVVRVLATMEYLKDAEHNAKLLTTLVVTMTAVLTVLAIVGPLALIGVGALTALSTLMLGLGVLAVGIGALMQKFPALQSFLDTGIPVLIQLANGVGKMIGAFVGGIASEMMASLPSIGTSLSQFMDNAKGFIEGAKLVDASVATGAGILVGAILALTVAEFVNGLMSISPFIGSFADLGTQLSAFMTNAAGFIEGASSIKPELMDSVKTLASAILVLTGTNMLESITRFIGGESSLATFGSQLGALGTNLKTFVTNLGTFSEEQVTSVKCAGEAIKALADAASTIPNEGGWIAKILGENSLATFGSKLPQLGTDIKGFITNLGTFTDTQVKTIDCAGKAIKALADAASTIPNDGGLWGALCGENSLASFGWTLPGLGTNISGFVNNLGTFGDDKIATVECAGTAIKTLADAAGKIPNEGGLWAKIVGDNSLATFASKLPGLATNIKNFVSNLGIFGEERITTVKTACEVIKQIANLGKIDVSNLGGNLKDLGKDLEKFAGRLKDFCDDMKAVASKNVTSAVDKVKKVISLAKELSGVNIESLKSFGSTLKKIAKDGINGFIKELSGDDPVKKIKEAAEKLVKAYTKAIKDKKDDVKKAFKTVASEGVKGAESESAYKGFKSAGKYMVEGFAKGISANDFKAEAAAKAMAKAAKLAAEAALGIESPSKEMMKDGNWTVEGFVLGIENGISKIYKTGYSAGETFLNGFDESMDINSPPGEIIDRLESVGEAADIASDKSEKSVYEAGYKTGESYAKGVEAGSEKSLFQKLFEKKKLLESGTYAPDSDEYKSLADEIYSLYDEIRRANETYYKDVEKLDNDHKQKVKDSIAELTTAYDDAIKDRADSIKGTYGLFDAVEEKEKVDGKTLLDNLLGQWEAKGEWSANMNSLISKGVLNKDLIAELRQMGPEAAAEIAALNELSAAELARYNSIYEMNAKQATDIAKSELQSRRAMTEDEIANFHIQLNKLAEMTDKEGNRLIDDVTLAKLNEAAEFGMDDTILAAKLHETMTDLETEYVDSFTELRKNWNESMGITVEDTSKQFGKMVEDMIFIAGEQTQWTETGASMVEGLNKGIITKSSSLYSTIAKVMLNAVAAAKASIDSHSPSRVFMKIGEFMDMGLIVGLKNYAGKVVSATTDVGKRAISAMSDAISRTCDLINSDVDMQPTIRPVLDLSNVRSGSRTIGELMSFGSSVGVNANVGAISAMMSNRRQNGTNNDVVSAINDLRGELGRTGNSYNINGIQYNEGSEVAEAIETLVRAARIERRT